jgi:hypothetical protein
MPAPRGPESVEGDSFDAAPARSVLDEGEVHDEGERPSSPFPLTAARVSTPVPAAAPDDFDRDGAFGSDRAPAAPLTPWNNVPPLRLPQADTDSSPPVGIDELDEREDTIVGEVPKNLLELSSAGDENTRAYTAPQELIELARRKREERQQARGHSAAPRVESAAPPVPDPASTVTERPPKMRKRDEAARQAQSSRMEASRMEASRMAPTTPVAPSLSKATPVPSPARAAAVPSPRAAAPVIDSVPPLSDDDSAPPVNRSFVPERARSGRPGGSAPRLEVSPASDLDPGSIPSASEVMQRREPAPESVASSSKYKAPWLTGARRWVVVVGVFIVLGYAISRWRMLFLP